MSDGEEPTTSAHNFEMDVTEACTNNSIPETNDEVPKNEKLHEKHFATIEGELLDFEDFNEKLPDVDKTVDVKPLESEDGECATPEAKAPEKDNTVEEGEDEGACSEDEDLEEGEISSGKKENSQPAVCRFYHRGKCFYGSACRFLHPNDKKGNYNMFDPIPRNYTDSYSASNMGILNHHRHIIPFLPAPPPPVPEVESAWERGLKEAKILVKQANKRKDEPDFEEKRLNMGLVNNKFSDFDKENDSLSRRERRNKSSERRGTYRYRDICNYTSDDNDSKNSNPYVNEGDKNGRERSRARRSSPERCSRAGSRHRWKSSRLENTRTHRSDQYFDPWQRSKSPTRCRTSRSVSCSPVSSYSHSSRSSRSSSQSSYASSRRTSSSRSPSRSHSRSLSMDSVSSASSRNSSVSLSPRSGSTRNRKTKPVSRAAVSNYPKSPPKVKVKTESNEETLDNMQENLQKQDVASISSLMPNYLEKPREPARSFHKQPIRLTLLNKNPQPKLSNLPKSPDTIKKAELTKMNLQRSVKRSLSPSPVQTATVVKKSTTTRRDDLLKQLRAVEDAIARKKARF